MHAHRRWLGGSAAFLVGAGLAAAALVGWQVAGGRERPGAEVTLLARHSDDLAVAGGGIKLTKQRMQPSAPDGGLTRQLHVRNATGKAVAVRVRAIPARGELDRILQLIVEARGREIFQGPLHQLRRGTTGTFLLARKEAAELSIRAWIPTSVRSGYEARAETVALEFVTRAAPAA